jgi:hypothetical protein
MERQRGSEGNRTVTLASEREVSQAQGFSNNSDATVERKERKALKNIAPQVIFF